MNTKHTPTPWRVIDDCGLTVDGPQAGIVCDFCESIGCSEDEKRANAEFIVRACNSHAELLKACKDARSVIRCMSGDTLAVLRQLDAAIEKGEGAA